MAKKQRTPEQSTDHQEHAAEHPAAQPQETATNRQKIIDEKKARLEYMQWVQQLLRSTLMRRDIEHEQKKEVIIDALMERGSPDDEIAYIMTKKPGRDGNEYYGFTFSEMNDVKDEISTLEMLSRKRDKFVSAEFDRRQNKTGNEGHGEGHGGGRG
jgi:hypothetical protein